MKISPSCAMSNKPKILYLMAGDPSIFGGGKRVFMQLMTYLNKEEFQFYSCCAFDKEQEEFLSKQGGTIVHIDIQCGGFRYSIKKLIDLLREEKIDIIHSQGARADFYSRVATKLARQKTKIVNTVAVLVEKYNVGILRKRIYCSLDGFTERYTDKFIVVSDALKKSLIITHCIPKQKVVKIYNGVRVQEYRIHDCDKSYRKTKKELGIHNEVFVIGAIGRLVWGKGFEYLIEAIPEIVRHMPDARFLLVGDGPRKQRLEALSEELRVRDNVIFAGFRSDIKEILSAIDILVIPSLLEGFPMITLEAMAMAKPIVATNIDGITEQITDEVNGILVPPKNPAALAIAIIELFRNKERAQKLGLSARKKVEQEFSVEKMVAETERVYLSIMGI